MFPVDRIVPWNVFEVIPFGILSVLGGLYGAAFIKFNVNWCRMRKHAQFGKYPITEIVILTAITCSLSYLNEFARIPMSGLIKLLFSSCSQSAAKTLDFCAYNYTAINQTASNTEINPSAPMTPVMVTSLFSLLYVAIIKSILTVFTFGTKVPCGLFIPTLCIGAIVGRIFGIIIEQLTFMHSSFWLWSSVCSTASVCAVPSVYAMVGAAAFLGGVTRMTVSLVVIMFELTGSLNHIVPFMIAAMVSKWVADAFKNGGIYDDHIELNGYPFLDNKEEFHDTRYAIDVMRPRKGDPPLQTLQVEGLNIGQLEKICKESVYQGFPVVLSSHNPKLVGFVIRKELLIALHEARMSVMSVSGATVVSFQNTKSRKNAEVLYLSSLVDFTPVTLNIHTPMEIVVEYFKKLGNKKALIMHHGKLLGILTKKDVLKHVLKVHGKSSDILFN